MEGYGPTTEDIKELRDLVAQNLKIAEETQHMLHSMRTWGRISFWFKLIFWIIVLGLPTLLLYPYLAPLIKLLPPLPAGSSTSFLGLPSPSVIQAWLQGMMHPATAIPSK